MESISEEKVETLPKKSPKSKRRVVCCKSHGCFGFWTFMRTSWRTFNEFSADTSIHGIKYLTDPRLPWTEKLFWAIALILSGVAAGYFILNTFQKWKQMPVIVTLSENFMNVWEIPFPALTVCPVLRAGSLLNYNGPRPHRYNLKISRISNVTWMGKAQPDNKMFHQTITEEGTCYTFNSLNFKDIFNENVTYDAYNTLKDVDRTPSTKWSLEHGYSNRDVSVHPRRAGGSGKMSGLSFLIRRDLAELNLSEEKYGNHEKGFLIAFHLPNEVPRMDKRFYRFPIEKSVTIIVNPFMVVTEQLSSYDVKTRGCYMEGEKKLKYFRNYTRSNCQVECLANYTSSEDAEKSCKCVHYSMPRVSNETICNTVEKEKCYQEGKIDIIKHTMEKSLSTSNNYLEAGDAACGCLPACTSLEYDGEISIDELRYFTQPINKTNNTDRYFRSLVTIFLKHDDFIYSKRSELFTFTEFIANFGGILGLFLGVSLLSIVEVFYFIAFRNVDADKGCTHDKDVCQDKDDDVNI